jgi:Fe-S cluster biosynthesis and repair protein YggX
MNKPPTRASRVKPSRDPKGKTALAEKQPTSLLEIVPGKFNESDWNNMLEIEDSQEYVWELIDEVFDNTIKIIYDKYIQKQTIPYTINEARKAILHIIDWQFLTRDSNDDLNDKLNLWRQDLGRI